MDIDVLELDKKWSHGEERCIEKVVGEDKKHVPRSSSSGKGGVLEVAAAVLEP